MTERTLAGGLTVVHSADRVAFRFPSGTGVCFDRRGHRAASSLLFGTGPVRIDVSLQPASIVLEVDAAARDEGIDPNRWRTAVLHELRQWWPQLQWCEVQPNVLVAAVGAITHPVLGHVYREGRQPLAEVPRWATDVLRCDTVQAAAEALAPGATRRLTKALAESLLGAGDNDPTTLGPLAAASVGRDLCTVDELANLLSVPNAAGPDRLPSVDELASARQALGLYPAGRRAALLDDTTRHHDMRELAEVGKYLWWARDKVERPLPLRLRELRERCRHHVPVIADRPAGGAAGRTAGRFTDSDPAYPANPADQAGTDAFVARASAPAPRRRTPAAPAGAAPVAAPHLDAQPHLDTQPHLDAQPVLRPRPAAFAAPRVRLPGRTPDRWPVPAALLQVHQVRYEGLSFSVPTSRNELATWGAILRNCLGDFARAAASQASWLIGIERDDRLIGCVEVNPAALQVRQALGPRNQPLPDAVHRATIALLRRHGIIN
jgi:hypothetical protein